MAEYFGVEQVTGNKEFPPLTLCRKIFHPKKSQLPGLPRFLNSGFLLDIYPAIHGYPSHVVIS